MNNEVVITKETIDDIFSNINKNKIEKYIKSLDETNEYKTSKLQNILEIGYNSAGRITDYFCQLGLIVESDGTAREKTILDKNKLKTLLEKYL